MCHFQQQMHFESYLRGVCKVSHSILLRSAEGDSKATSLASVQFSVRATHIAALLCASIAALKSTAAELLAVVKLYNVNEEKYWWGTACDAKTSRTHPPKAAMILP